MKKFLLISLMFIFATNLVSAQKKLTAKEYIANNKQLAIQSMEEYGIPASIKLAQALLESSNGNSILAIEANNHFGIKCKSNWAGLTISHDDDAKNECFRKYKNIYDSYRDHSDFITNSSRYRFLFDLSPTDYEGWARGLSYAGYATNPDYANLLIKTIESHELYKLDALIMKHNGGKLTAESSPKNLDVSADNRVAKGATTNAKGSKGVAIGGGAAVAGGATAVASKSASYASAGDAVSSASVKVSSTDGAVAMRAPQRSNAMLYDGPKFDGSGMAAYKSSPCLIYKNNNIPFVIATEGDTFESISARTGVNVPSLVSYNEMPQASAAIAPGSIVYISSKASKVINGYLVHNVIKGESLHYVSQKYGIKIGSLAKFNGVDAGYEIKPGQKIKLK